MSQEITSQSGLGSIGKNHRLQKEPFQMLAFITGHTSILSLDRRAVMTPAPCLSVHNQERYYGDKEDSIMPHYVFHCLDCNKEFTQILHMADLEKGDVVCPQCVGSRETQTGPPFPARAAK